MKNTKIIAAEIDYTNLMNDPFDLKPRLNAETRKDKEDITK